MADQVVVDDRNRLLALAGEHGVPDADDLDINNFYTQFQEDLAKDSSVKEDGSVRDSDGFYVLIPRNKSEGIDLEGLPGKVIQAKIA